MITRPFSQEKQHMEVLHYSGRLPLTISPLDNIKSDRIVGIHCQFPGHVLLFILGVYLPSASHDLEEYGEYFDYLWTLYDSLSSNCKVILMGDFNGDLGNSLGNKGRREPNQHGLKLLDLANDFNMCLICVNLMNMCAGPLEKINSFCGRYHTTLDYIFVPNCLLSSITSAKTFEADPDNTSDHLPIQLTLTINYNFASYAGNSQRSKKKPKIKWSKFSLEVINTQHVSPPLHDLENGDIDSTISISVIQEKL